MVTFEVMHFEVRVQIAGRVESFVAHFTRYRTFLVLVATFAMSSQKYVVTEHFAAQIALVFDVFVVTIVVIAMGELIRRHDTTNRTNHRISVDLKEGASE